jgi:hypothetical protein
VGAKSIFIAVLLTNFLEIKRGPAGGRGGYKPLYPPVAMLSRSAASGKQIALALVR